MIDHVGLNVSEFERSRHFYEQAPGYEQAPAPLGITIQMEFGKAAGFGVEGKPFFWIREEQTAGAGTHVAFHFEERAPVDAFHAAALAAGGTDNGQPGPRRTITRATTARSRSTPIGVEPKRASR